MKHNLLLFIALTITNLSCLAQTKPDIHIQHFSEANGFSEALVTSIIQDKQGYIWLGTWDGLRKYDGYNFTTYKARPGDNSPLETNRIYYIKENPDHTILCWSNSKFYCFNPKNGKFSLSRTTVRPELYHPSKNTQLFINECKEYKNINYEILLEDRQGGIWVNSYRGLERISRKHINPKTEKITDIGEEVICATHLDKRNRLWIADKNGIIRVFNNRIKVLYLTTNGQLSTSKAIFGHSAYKIFEDSKGNIWIGTKPGGLFRLTPEESHFKIKRFVQEKNNPYSINCNSIYDIQEDAQQRILIATYGGGLNIAEETPSGQIQFIHKGNLLKSFPSKGMKSRCIAVMPTGTILIGTNGGLYTAALNKPYREILFKENSRRPHDKNSISNNIVMKILRTKKGEIYLCTSGGGTDKILSSNLLSDTIRFRHFSTNEGMSSDMNLTMIDDTNGHIWIASTASLSVLNTDNGMITNHWNLLSEPGEKFSEATPAMTPDGMLIFGTTKGFLPISMQELQKSQFIPNIVFNCDKIINLSPNEKDLTIHFAALDYNKNEDIIYAYKMEGIDDTWRYTRINELNYVRLAPGDYKLHIKSTNGEGIWVDNEETISIHRSAHFNETPWAWMLYGLLITLFAIGTWITIKYIHNLKRELKDVKLSSKEQIEILGSQLKEMIPITKEVKEIQNDENKLCQEDRIFADRLKAFIHKNISNPDLSVMDIAQAMNVSRTILFVRTKNIFDSSPNNYVLNTRIDYAKTLLKEKNIRMSEVAYRCGFSDPKYFSRCFKKITGQLPKDYAYGEK